MAKVAFIGAGSTAFIRTLLGDLLSHPELAEVTIALHDGDHERLETVAAVARWTAAQTGTAPKISAHLDRRHALDGADYVINTSQVGGHDATVLDYQLPASYGVRQTIGDTLGVGGVFRALRTIPVLRDILAEMTDLCPQAWLLNHANPMATLCWASTALSPHQKIVGLCHSIPDTVDKLADLVGVPVDEVGFLAAGVNHQSFVLRLEHGGVNLYPKLEEAIARDLELERTVRVEMYRRFGYFPTGSSEHSAEYVPWFLHDDDAIRRFRLEPGECVRASLDDLAEYRQTRTRLFGGDVVPTGLEPIESDQEFAPRVIHAIESGHPRAVYGSVRNTGLIDNLPEGACVEVPCLVDGTGVHPMPIGSLPPQLAALNRSFLNVCELTVLAATEGCREHVYHAAMTDPNTAATLSPRDIQRLCDAMISAHGDLMPIGIRLPRWQR